MFQSNYTLANLNTFGIKAFAKLYVEVRTMSELSLVWQSPEYRTAKNVLVLGGGSNLLFTQDFDGLVIHNLTKGISTEAESAENTLVTAASGENWHHFVLSCVQMQLGGIENLSLIPGTVGAAPVQNIGAYGVELKDVMVSLEAFDFQTGKIQTIKKEECAFGYRDSIFKSSAKGRYFITSVRFRLQNFGFHKLNTSYGAIGHVIQEMQVSKPTISEISKAVIQIRSSKLPDPKVVGNAGSFFKNPEVLEEKCNELLKVYPKMPFYDSQNAGFKKLAAGWLIEQCGWKGKSLGNAAVHSLQALVLTNPGHASGNEIKELAIAIQQSVGEKFGVTLETEVNIL
jgi:UDP-N-acetylmuramate dehydrogenase